MGSQSPEYVFENSESCASDSCICSKCARNRKFQQFLSHLTSASTMINHEEEISTVVARILDDIELRAPLQLDFLTEFDDNKHTVDYVAQKYLEQASKSVQHLIPVRTSIDGNCLFHSVVAITSSSDISVVELRVRTVVELVKNKDYYVNQCGRFVGPFDKAVQRACNNKCFCELYEIVALANVLQCNVQSVYPYIDYRAEMKIMNATYKPTLTSVSNARKIIIFWTNTNHEVDVRNRPGCRGIWSPNHFVPLISQNRLNKVNVVARSIPSPETPRKSTTKNNQPSSIRSPEFPPPSNNRRRKILVVRSFSSSDESESQSNTYDAQRKRQQRVREDEQQRNIRLLNDRLQKQIHREQETGEQRTMRLLSKRVHSQVTRENETEDERTARLSNKRIHTQLVRENETEQEQNARLLNDRENKKASRQHEDDDERRRRLQEQRQRTSEKRSRELHSNGTLAQNSSSRRRISREEWSVIPDEYIWPSAIPTSLKELCLEDFANSISISSLRQSICVLCNSCVDFSTTKEYLIGDIANLDYLSYHPDISHSISKIQESAQDDGANSSFFRLSNGIFYKKGYNAEKNTGYVCQQCHSALNKNKIPIFSSANKMWIGDVPSVLQQLTIAEEKLISVYRHNSCVIKLQSPFHHQSTAQTALKGNVITFMQNVPNIVKSLPLDVEDLCDTLKIVFVGARIPNRVELRRVCGVSRQRVHDALLWLKSNNYMYRNMPSKSYDTVNEIYTEYILVNEINIRKLPENDVPECIWSTIERIENVEEGNAERTGIINDPLRNITVEDEPSTTNTFPMNTSAVLDVNGTTVSSEDIRVHLLQKLTNNSTNSSTDMLDRTSETEEDDVYLIPRSTAPVRDCYNAELLLGLFPTLFPYGCGVPHDESRPIPVSLIKHVRYLLSYGDHRFEKHHSFMFVLFNMIQRQQACWNASLIASQPYFRDVATDLQALSSKEIETALMHISKKEFSSVNNSRINSLLKQIKTVSGNVMGSACSRAVLRNKIHALIFNQGLPSIFMTINPADVHSRIALYFAGIDLDLDKILPSEIPSTYERAQIIAAHPVATARFFNVLITSILKCMVEKGVLGPIKAYFGTVENQGRGSLHLHILLWIDHDLTPMQLKELIQNRDFRNGLLSYLEDIIKQDLSNFELENSTADTLEQQQIVRLRSNNSVDLLSDDELSQDATDEHFENNTLNIPPSLMPTPKPSSPNFSLNFKRDVVKLVNSNNIHAHTVTCYKYSKKQDNPVCRMRMPRKIENTSFIDIESGEIRLKRLHETINNFNEYIISACRSNMDIKYIFSGSDAKALVYYITDYVTKSNLSFHDTFSLVLKAVQSLEKYNVLDSNNMSAEEKSRRLVLRCYNTLASQQELSAPQVASYLMGWSDHYTTHEFANLFLIGIENYLQATLIETQTKQHCEINDNANFGNEENCMETEEQFLLQPNETNTKYVYVNTRVDYQYRSSSLEGICLYDYIRYYRKKPSDAKDRKYLKDQLIAKDTHSEENVRRGRPPSEREPFLSEHPQALSHINVKRVTPVIPILLGPQIPRRDREDTKERYYRSILVLFSPWRSISDLCNPDETWEQAFQIRQLRIRTESQKIIDNIQLLQECKSDRDEHLQQVVEAAQTEIVDERVKTNNMVDISDDDDDENNEIFDLLDTTDIDEIPVVKELGNRSEQVYFEKTIQVVDRANRFASIKDLHTRSTNRSVDNSVLNKQTNYDMEHLVPATTELILLNNRWQRTIREEKEQKRNAFIMIGIGNEHHEQNDAIENPFDGGVDNALSSNCHNDKEVINFNSVRSVAKVTVPIENTRQCIADQFTLNKNQRAAYMVITGHLDGLDRLNEDDKQSQLIMCVPGCGGTGKSQLIRAITAYFTETNRAYKLRKLAPTSVAAAEIEGMTIHSFLGAWGNRKKKSNVGSRPGETKIENEWRFVEYMILDEMSMVGLSLLGRLNKLVTTAKHCDPMTTMGGINIILFGDYIQYSPVLDKPLYYDFSTATSNKTKKTVKLPTENEIQQKSARALILQINCVVILEQQMRTTDLPYQALLNRVRNGEGTHEDWLLLRTRVLGIGLHISLNDPPWNEAPILVYRNEIRTELNNRAVINKAYEIKQPATVVIARDTIRAKKNIDLPDLNRRLLALPDNKTEHLPGYLPLMPGMPVLLQENIACELGLSNGTQGIFRKLVYTDTSDSDISFDQYKFPTDTVFIRNPQYALVEIPKSKINKLDSLNPLIVPIPLTEKTFTIDLDKLYSDKQQVTKLLKSNKLKTTISVKRKTLPLIPAYSITTHKSQGQTLRKIVIDLNMPPGMVEVASAYVPLSRVQRLTDLVITQDFSINALQVKPSKGQLMEINRLAVIFGKTKQRYAKYFA